MSGRNVEIKARARNFERKSGLALELASRPAEHLVQRDTFFNVPAGRLKLRHIDGRAAELIHYDRRDGAGPKESRYTICPVDDPAQLEKVLANALGVRGMVRKKRIVALVGQTRIHLDRVEGLGEFIELEVVLDTGQDLQYGTGIAETLMSQLEIEKTDLVEAAYLDLL